SSAAAPVESYALSLHDALPISVASSAVTRWIWPVAGRRAMPVIASVGSTSPWIVLVVTACGAAESNDSSWLALVTASSGSAEARSEEHTSELQSRGHLVCRLLL